MSKKIWKRWFGQHHSHRRHMHGRAHESCWLFCSIWIAIVCCAPPDTPAQSWKTMVKGIFCDKNWVKTIFGPVCWVFPAFPACLWCNQIISCWFLCVVLVVTVIFGSHTLCYIELRRFPGATWRMTKVANECRERKKIGKCLMCAAHQAILIFCALFSIVRLAVMFFLIYTFLRHSAIGEAFARAHRFA